MTGAVELHERRPTGVAAATGSPQGDHAAVGKRDHLVGRAAITELVHPLGSPGRCDDGDREADKRDQKEPDEKSFPEYPHVPQTSRTPGSCDYFFDFLPILNWTGMLGEMLDAASVAVTWAS